MRFLAALLPLLTTLVGKIFAALGLTAVIYVGFDAMVDKFKALIVQHVGSMGADWLGLFYLVGGGTVLNIMFGAMTFVVSVKSVSKLANVFGSKK